jgi:DNA-binding GntR family transcriptional regulator
VKIENDGVPTFESAIEQPRLVDRVYSMIRDAIDNGALEPGERLVQDQLARMFKVSRSPIREAVVRLEKDGYVRVEPYRGAVVNDLTVQEMLQIYEIREGLEPFAAARATERATRVHRQTLKNLVATGGGPRTKHPADHYRASVDFHLSLVEPCGNPLMIETLAGLWRRGTGSLMFRKYREATGTTDQSAAEHAAIVKAFCAGEADLVYRLAVQHIQASRQLLVGDR